MSDISATITATLSAVTADGSSHVDNVVPTIILSDGFPEGFYEALGRVAVAFGRLEYSVLIAMKRLRQAERQRQGQPRKSFNDALLEDIRRDFKKCERQGVRLFVALVADGARQAAFKSVFGRARSLWEKERNDCIHACWTATSDCSAMRLRPKKEQVQATGVWVLTWEQSGTIPIAELLRIANEVDDTAAHIRQATAAL